MLTATTKTTITTHSPLPEARPRRQFKASEKGMALIETIPLLVIFVMFIGFVLGLFGAIHTAILHSIGARTYAFETFRNRTNLLVFRETASSPSRVEHYKTQQIRFHAVNTDGRGQNLLSATERPIVIGKILEAVGATDAEHNTRVFKLNERNNEVAVHPIWVKVGYGMCLNPGCGDQ